MVEMRLFMRRADISYLCYSPTIELIGAHHFCPLPLWPLIFGRVPISQFPLCPPIPQADRRLFSKSKRWIVDRATLKQARAEDMRYVKDPLFFDLFNIFTGNRAAVFLPPPVAEHRY